MSENNEKIEKAEKTVKSEKKKTPKKERKRPFHEMFSELKKVSWPTKADIKTYAASVIIFVVVCAVLLFVMDFAVTNFIKLISEPDKLPGLLNGWFGIGG